MADMPAFRRRFGDSKYSEVGEGEGQMERDYHRISNIVEKISLGPDGRETAKTLSKVQYQLDEK